MTTYPLATMACTVTSTGITAPPYTDVLENLKWLYRSIFGSDVYLEPDSQDGQLLAIFASGINDCNAATIAAYNAFSPATAQGAGLSSVVAINNIARHVASNSTADVTIVGQVGTVITDGFVGDGTTRWALPSTVTIPTPDGEIIVTATCTEAGAVSAAADALTQILTPTLGWQTVTNVAAATEGAPVETDAQLRLRQQISTALSAETPLRAVGATVAALPGVTRMMAYENDTGAPDADGISANSIAIVVEGGDAQTIAEVIFDKKGIGTATFGSTTESVNDPYGVAKDVNFSRPTIVPVKAELSIHPLTGYTSTVQDAIKAAVVAYVNAGAIGGDVIRTRLYLPGNLYGAQPDSLTYEITQLRIAKVPDALAAADIVIDFDEAASIDLAHVTVVIV